MTELKKLEELLESGDIANRLLYVHCTGDLEFLDSNITSYEVFNEIRKMEQEHTLKDFLYEFAAGNGDLVYKFDTCIGCLEMAIYSLTLRLERRKRNEKRLYI